MPGLFDRLPDPPLPPDADLRGVPWNPMTHRLTRMITEATRGDPAAFTAAVKLAWAAFWQEVPAGSLPDDDQALARLAECDIRRWKHIRHRALEGWVLSSDGRFYHPEIVPRVQAVLREREGGAERKRRQRGKADDHDPTPPAHAQSDTRPFPGSTSPGTKAEPQQNPTQYCRSSGIGQAPDNITRLNTFRAAKPLETLDPGADVTRDSATRPQRMSRVTSRVESQREIEKDREDDSLTSFQESKNHPLSESVSLRASQPVSPNLPTLHPEDRKAAVKSLVMLLNETESQCAELLVKLIQAAHGEANAILKAIRSYERRLYDHVEDMKFRRDTGRYKPCSHERLIAAADAFGVMMQRVAQLTPDQRRQMPCVNDPVERWGALADSWEISVYGDDEIHACRGGAYIDVLAHEIVMAGHLQHGKRYEWTYLAKWLDDGYSGEQITNVVKHAAAWSGYTPPVTLKYFDTALRKLTPAYQRTADGDRVSRMTGAF